jgi:di/tricarboxylate transporter
MKVHHLSLYFAIALSGLYGLDYISSAFFCMALVILMLVLLVKEVFAPEITMVGTLAFLVLGSNIHPDGFLKANDAINGFANPSVMTIAALFVVASAVRMTGIFDQIARIALGDSQSSSSCIARMALPLMALSAFFNNTPIVSIFMPILRDWGLKRNISPSKLLIPLSYLTAFGGLFTLLGTSTHLVVQGLAHQAGASTFGMFDLAYVGIPLGLLGSLYLVCFAHKLLPDSVDLLQSDNLKNKTYTVEMVIDPNSPLHGKSITEAGLRDLGDLFLVEVIREGEVSSAVKSSFILHSKDRLIFTGSRDKVIDLHKLSGLSYSHHQEGLVIGRNCRLIEVVIGPNSHLRGKSLKDVFFNRTYNASVIGIHRGGEQLRGGLGRLPLQMGDTLILLADIGFRRIWQESQDFMMVSPIRDDLYHRKWAPLCIALLIPMIALPSFDILPIFITSLLTAITFCWLKVLDHKQILQSIDWGVLLTIGASFGISKALLSSGASQYLSYLIVEWGSVVGPLGALFLIYFLTNILTEVITNNAAAALAFPIALTCAQNLHINPFIVSIVVAVAASSSFATPIGYQTNMIVYGPGGYRYTDFLKIGTPLNLLFGVVTCLLAPCIWPLLA